MRQKTSHKQPGENHGIIVFFAIFLEKSYPGTNLEWSTEGFRRHKLAPHPQILWNKSVLLELDRIT